MVSLLWFLLGVAVGFNGLLFLAWFSGRKQRKAISNLVKIVKEATTRAAVQDDPKWQ